jgi:hypothetical protein
MAAAWNEAARNIAPAYESTVEIEKRIDECRTTSSSHRRLLARRPLGPRSLLPRGHIWQDASGVHLYKIQFTLQEISYDLRTTKYRNTRNRSSLYSLSIKWQSPSLPKNEQHTQYSATSEIYDALILGAGPSAALGLARVHRSALVLSHNSFRNNGGRRHF